MTALLTIPEVAATLNVSERTTKRLIAAGDIASLVIAGRARRVHPDDVDAYVARCRASTTAAAPAEPTDAPEQADVLLRSTRSPARRALHPTT